MNELPFRLQSRPAHEGTPIPFITFIDKDEKPLWKVTHPGRFFRGIMDQLCGACGQRIGKAHFPVFIVPPLGAIGHVSFTLPMHMDCAQWMVSNFPTLRGDGLWALYVTRGYKVRRATVDGRLLFLLSIPATREGVTWHTQGRAATRDEVLGEFDKCIPLECDRIQKECPPFQHGEALRRFELQYKAIVQWLPKETPEPDKGEEWKGAQ